MKKNIVILGSTGSIGVNTLKVIDKLGPDYRVAGLAAGSNIALLKKQIKRFRPAVVTTSNEKFSRELKTFIGKVSPHTKVLSGPEGLKELASYDKADFVVSALVGAVGLVPTIEAIKSGKDVALANKEVLVMAGSLISRLRKSSKTRILPVDSEHSAIFQCIKTEDINRLSKIILTASGGPFFNFSNKELRNVTVEQALRHPTWRMGRKITIDSATLFNKGMEVIEARHLFSVCFDKISILIHPQAVIHSMVEFIDGSVIAQLGVTDMRLPIQYALTYPERVKTSLPYLNLARIKSLNFFSPDFRRFPCFGLALDAGKMGHTMPTVASASNEMAISAFLSEKIKFSWIPHIIEYVMNSHSIVKDPSLEDIIEADKWARTVSAERIERC